MQFRSVTAWQLIRWSLTRTQHKYTYGVFALPFEIVLVETWYFASALRTSPQFRRSRLAYNHEPLQSQKNSSKTLCSRCAEERYSPSYFSFPLLIIIPPLFHVYLSPLRELWDNSDQTGHYHVFGLHMQHFAGHIAKRVWCVFQYVSLSQT
jgi:hypothetical protein